MLGKNTFSLQFTQAQDTILLISPLWSWNPSTYKLLCDLLHKHWYKTYLSTYIPCYLHIYILTVPKTRWTENCSPVRREDFRKRSKPLCLWSHFRSLHFSVTKSRRSSASVEKCFSWGIDAEIWARKYAEVATYLCVFVSTLQKFTVGWLSYNS